MASVRPVQGRLCSAGTFQGVTWTITAFYRFTPLPKDGLSDIRASIASYMAERQMLGLVVIGEEGINGTVAGTGLAIHAFKQYVQGLLGIEDLRFKDSESDVAPFLTISVDIRDEIVTMKKPGLVPAPSENRHLCAKEWHEMLSSDTPKIVIDTRNDYETIAGKFRGAIDPQIENFAEWSSYLDKAEIPRDVPVLIYCTGGIRCEKAILEMKDRGFEDVYQLRDGILGYLEEFPNGLFEGECFVFDRRVTVGPDLKPTGNFGVCAGCGTTTPQKQTCEFCGKLVFFCPQCSARPVIACSKACRDRVLHRRRRAA
ncbi:MAG: rhodanese-like domain-containing protein [Fimbriimonas sp.]